MKLIHVASIRPQKQGIVYLFLKQMDTYRYVWFREDEPGIETETSIWGGTAEEAIAAALKYWKIDLIETLNCGFRYTLPERDEVGHNALFHQMISSYSSSNGIYFDEELGANCTVNNASLEARLLWKRLQENNQIAV